MENEFVETTSELPPFEGGKEAEMMVQLGNSRRTMTTTTTAEYFMMNQFLIFHVRVCVHVCVESERRVENARAPRLRARDEKGMHVTQTTMLR